MYTNILVSILSSVTKCETVTVSLRVLSKNCRDCPPISNAVYRLSIACFVFDISGGGYPPPIGTKMFQTPVGARVYLQFVSQWQDITR